MPDIEIAVEGLDALLRANERTRAGLGEVVRRLLRRSALSVQAEAMRRTPVVSGTLRRSLTVAVDPAPSPQWARVGANLVYAPFIEFGERHLKAGSPTVVRRRAGPARMLRDGAAAAKAAIEAAARAAAQEIKALWHS